MTIESQLPPTTIAFIFTIYSIVKPTSPVNSVFFISTKIYVISLFGELLLGMCCLKFKLMYSYAEDPAKDYEKFESRPGYPYSFPSEIYYSL